MIDTKKIRERLYDLHTYRGDDMQGFKNLHSAFVDLLEEIDMQQNAEALVAAEIHRRQVARPWHRWMRAGKRVSREELDAALVRHTGRPST